MKKIIALFVSSIFALSLGIAYAQETTPNPWERDQQRMTSAKKAKKMNKKRVNKEKTEKKNEQKKKYIFW